MIVIADSWIEVSSQPSSSSLSSAGGPSPGDEIITTGLRVQHDSNAQRRRRQLDRARSGGLHIAQSQRGASSSQEEYEESESESDRVMTSSNEGLAQPSPLQREWRPTGDTSSTSSNHGDVEEEDSDENDRSTAINVGRRQSHSFQPQPNAFNRPPSTSGQHAQSTQSYNPSPPSRPTMRTGSQRHSYPAQRQAQHSPFNAISPSYQADQDAALRASLSTLLSCAAAARGLPKSGNTYTNANPIPGSSARNEPTSLRIVPESAILGTSPPRNSSNRATAGMSSPRSRSADKSKRRASSKDRSRKKPRRANSNTGFAGTAAHHSTYGFGTYSVDDISPTLFTWVVSAGVVVLVSALSFSAGYVVGKEAGRQEAVSVGSCGREAVRGSGLRRRLFEVSM